MAVSQRVYRQRIRSTETLKKMFRAMELIAASRITRARDRAMKASPYARALTQATSAVAAHASTDHPLLQEDPESKRAAMLVLTADRGMAGAYTATVLRAAEKMAEELTEQGKEIDLYVVGRRGLSYYTFRQRRVVASWTGESDNPSADLAREIGRTLIDAFLTPEEEGGVGELHIVFTKFNTMVSQEQIGRASCRERE